MNFLNSPCASIAIWRYSSHFKPIISLILLLTSPVFVSGVVMSSPVSSADAPSILLPVPRFLRPHSRWFWWCGTSFPCVQSQAQHRCVWVVLQSYCGAFRRFVKNRLFHRKVQSRLHRKLLSFLRPLCLLWGKALCRQMPKIDRFNIGIRSESAHFQFNRFHRLHLRFLWKFSQ